MISDVFKAIKPIRKADERMIDIICKGLGIQKVALYKRVTGESASTPADCLFVYRVIKRFGISISPELTAEIDRLRAETEGYGDSYGF